MDGIPRTGAFARFLLENPWPAVVVMAVLAIVLLKLARDRDDRRLLSGALAAALVGAAVWIVSWSVTTPGEHARRVVGAFVEAAEAGDVPAMHRWLVPDASLHLGALTAPGLDRQELDRALSLLESKHRVESNSITMLRAGALSSDAAIAELGCITTTHGSYGPVPSSWLFRVERQPDGSWRIRRLAAVSIAGRPAEPRSW